MGGKGEGDRCPLQIPGYATGAETVCATVSAAVVQTGDADNWPVSCRRTDVHELCCGVLLKEERREDVLVNLCMRQSIQERRIAVQLMQLRHEKDVIRRNRLAKEKQFEEARVKEFQEALDREKVDLMVDIVWYKLDPEIDRVDL